MIACEGYPNLVRGDWWEAVEDAHILERLPRRTVFSFDPFDQLYSIERERSVATAESVWLSVGVRGGCRDAGG